MTSNLANFGLPERLRCSLGLRRVAQGAASLEDAAQRFCRYYYDELVDEDGSRACALVRCYVTHPFGRLPSELQEFARAAAGAPFARDTRCLTLVGTAGLEPEWNSRRGSRDHQAIPLVSTEMVENAPMIAQLIRAFGLNVSDVAGSGRSIVKDLGGKTYGVFYVPEALDSSYIPAQKDFIERYAVRSVVGSGGALASGELFAIVLFSRVAISPDAAERFRALALDAKAALLRYSADDVFDEPAARAGRSA
jgi:hypothetical protein